MFHSREAAGQRDRAEIFVFLLFIMFGGRYSVREGNKEKETERAKTETKVEPFVTTSS